MRFHLIGEAQLWRQVKIAKIPLMWCLFTELINTHFYQMHSNALGKVTSLTSHGNSTL
jgi:hypothetical protein